MKLTHNGEVQPVQSVSRLGYGLGDLGLISGGDNEKNFFLSSLWGPSSLLTNGYRRLLPWW